MDTAIFHIRTRATMPSYGTLSEALYPLGGNPAPRLISSPAAFSSFRPGVGKYCTWACARIPNFGLTHTYPQPNSLSHPEFHCTARRFALLQENYKLKSANLCNPTLIRASMDGEKEAEAIGHSQVEPQSMKILFVEMGVGYDQHGQDITAAAMRACRDAISSNSIPAFRTGAVPGVNFDQMKLKIRLGVPLSTQGSLDIERVKSVFPYGNIISIEVVDGGLLCSSGVCLESMGDKNDDCYIVNAAVYVGY